ncbi:MAG TPA: YqgE/AlgH family protein [Saprospiraceae bacterium]|nr:YqgE/AlgH family protein [Saprospiraceae bacterium]HOY14381.1 YqgE/AlgH family protein [Saprospiraceae bacterium]HPN71612.1 YqgE/AlgH family protein [Saprospiraceae bacterium]
MENILETGKLLISEPFSQDVNFKRTVVLISDYREEDGTVGFVLNRPTNLKINDLLSDFPEIDSKVYYGGPVAIDTIHYIHCKGDIVDDSRFISKGLFWGGNFDKLKFLIDAGLILASDIKFFIGYSGWSPGQLEEEMEEKSWIIADMDINYAFTNKIPDMWHHVLNAKGANYKVIADMSDSFSLN